MFNEALEMEAELTDEGIALIVEMVNEGFLMIDESLVRDAGSPDEGMSLAPEMVNESSLIKAELIYEGIALK